MNLTHNRSSLMYAI